MSEWFETDTDYSFQLRRFQNEKTARMLAIETDVQSSRHGMTPEEFRAVLMEPGENGRMKPLRNIAGPTTEKKEAMAGAFRYMSDNGGVG